MWSSGKQPSKKTINNIEVYFKTNSLLSNHSSGLNSSIYSKSQGLLITTPAVNNNQAKIVPHSVPYVTKNNNQKDQFHSSSANITISSSNPHVEHNKSNAKYIHDYSASNPAEIYSTVNKAKLKNNNNIHQQQQQPQQHTNELTFNRSKTPGPETVYFPNEIQNEEEELNDYFLNSNNINNQSQAPTNYPTRSKTPTAEMMSTSYEPLSSSSSNNFKNFASSSTMVKRKSIAPNLKEEKVNHWSQPDFFLNDFNLDDVRYDDFGDQYLEMIVELYKLETGFGFKIIGGKETNSQVSIGYIVYGGAAHINNRLRPNDEITTIDNECVIGATHKRVVQLMAIAGLNGKVKLRIKRKLSQQQYDILVKQHFNVENQRLQNIQQQQFQRQQLQMLQPKPRIQPSYPFKITLFRNPGQEFGFIIVSPLDQMGVQLIGNVFENSPAFQCNLLNVGDRILALNDQDVTHMQNFEIAKLIKESGSSITLTVEPKLANNKGFFLK